MAWFNPNAPVTTDEQEKLRQQAAALRQKEATGTLTRQDEAQLQAIMDKTSDAASMISEAGSPTWGTALAKTLAAGYVGKKDRERKTEQQSKLRKTLQADRDREARLEREKRDLEAEQYQTDLELRRQNAETQGTYAKVAQANLTRAEEQAQLDANKMTGHQFVRLKDGTSMEVAYKQGKPVDSFTGEPVDLRGAVPVSPTTAAERNAFRKESKADDTKRQGRKEFKIALDSLRGNYNELASQGRMVDDTKAIGQNVANYLLASAPFVEEAIGTKAATERSQAKATAPSLITRIMKATGMTSRQLDSNRELQFHLETLSNPKSSIQAANKSLDMLEKMYLDGSLDPANQPAEGEGAPAAQTVTDTGAVAPVTGEDPVDARWAELEQMGLSEDQIMRRLVAEGF
jgi:hypothetical protein